LSEILDEHEELVVRIIENGICGAFRDNQEFAQHLVEALRE